MKKAIICTLVAVMLITVVSAAVAYNYFGGDDDGGDGNGNGQPNTPILTGMNAFVNSSNEFTFDMYEELDGGEDNIFFSPYSISIALGMAYEGADGKTAEEMTDVLDLPRNDEQRRAMVRSLQSQLNKEGASYDLSTANAYWLREGEALNTDYENVIESDYQAHGEQLDFRGDPEGSADTINEWVEGETKDRIKDLISPGVITFDTYLVLTNALYFKSDWKYQFDPEATEEMDFYKEGGEAVEAEMMNMNDEEIDLNYAEDEDFQLLQLPYKGRDLSMTILLPKADDLAAAGPKVDHAYLKGLKKKSSSEYVNVYLPKFKFEQKYDLNDHLKAMGMPTAFTRDADFSGIAHDSRGLMIDKVIHQSFVEVNEEGTEAAAATAVVMSDEAAGGPEPPQPKYFRADHPFLFFIEHEDTGQILFMGKVGDPTV